MISSVVSFALPAGVDWAALTLTLAGALVAGFTSGFAGFGTGLVASGIWFHALPAHMVPLLICLTSVASQLVALLTISQKPKFSSAGPMMAGGLLGLPLGVVTLAVASPAALKASVGGFLVIYVMAQLTQISRLRVGTWGGRMADSVVGIGGGFLSGFCGLSGPLPIIWLQLRGGSVGEQRAIYQPFNLVMLSLASIAMLVAEPSLVSILPLVIAVLPATIIGAWLGAHAYGRVSEALFRRVVLTMLMVSGMILVGQVFLR